MLKITLSKFTEFTVKDIHKFLLQQKETVFKITIPRQAIIVRQDYVAAMVNYLSVAYAGQLLSKIATSFAYYVPCPTRKTSFYFLVVIPDKEKLAETLYLIIQCFNSNTKEEDLFFSFQDKAKKFLDQSYKDDSNCNTWGLMHIANKMLDP